MARIIKKYPNRRLYDTHESRYITLADIRALVAKQVDFNVVDKRSGEDITRTILLQVICDQEERGAPVLTAEFLARVIRASQSMHAESLAGELDRRLAESLDEKNQQGGQKTADDGDEYRQPVVEGGGERRIMPTS